MARIHPFPAILFRPVPGSGVTPLVAPPYDVIRPAARDLLRKRHPHNVVRLTLPEASAGHRVYQEAANSFHRWLETGVLHSAPGPAMYVWEQQFGHGDANLKRRALVAKVTCEPYHPGGVMRHEKTHAGPKADRLKLFRATGALFSPIFGIFGDNGGEVTGLLADAATPAPIQVGNGDDGHVSRLFAIYDPGIMERLQAMMMDKTIVIADGHHRYETSVAYYEEVGKTGATLMALVPSGDPGLVVLPTHRTIPVDLHEGDIRSCLADMFTIETFPWEQWSQLYQEASDHPARGIMVVVAPGQSLVVRLSWPTDDDRLGAPVTTFRQQGDVGTLHSIILPRLKDAAPVGTEDFGYFHDAGEAVDAAGRDGRWAFLLRPLSVAVLLDVAERQEVLPPKSTYFFPKFLAGFVNAYLD